MVYVIMSPNVLRGHVERSWKLRGAVFVGASTGVAICGGLALGAIGALLPVNMRLGLATILGLALAALGGLEAFGRGPLPLQRSCETPGRLLLGGALLGPIRNGVSLGHGATTRIGFWLWYSIPFSAFVLASPLLGAVLYGAYGLVRGAGPWLLVIAANRLSRRRGVDFGAISVWLLQNHERARRVTGCYAIVVGISIALAAQV